MGPRKLLLSNSIYAAQPNIYQHTVQRSFSSSAMENTHRGDALAENPQACPLKGRMDEKGSWQKSDSSTQTASADKESMLKVIALHLGM